MVLDWSLHVDVLYVSHPPLPLVVVLEIVVAVQLADLPFCISIEEISSEVVLCGEPQKLQT